MGVDQVDRMTMTYFFKSPCISRLTVTFEGNTDKRDVMFFTVGFKRRFFSADNKNANFFHQGCLHKVSDLLFTSTPSFFRTEV